ncbi:hypothetical protein BABINDRAFT_160757 [Babjeviella inositovora NRRL Y-12698]|uniref:Mitochondrial resolvase Ydc2 catalytic domain-containing protein n=1 Tax=Babjeviella inositovora NRRL Y-12698 TaxID=984486 RepID=A0A1E3QU69_9ASCO|nr:uncharacterized protein BABINDRAFT_160757 [Babjeviella inositovora NRRL Y-12698]ODQ80477.1 hypothetical protein BABINDRAFT_160757 [Babjeviella inositovora NRRL Y-12698]
MLSPVLLKARNDTLKAFCRHCGVSPTGNKSDLVAALSTGFIAPNRKPYSVLSIDMGIRNFSFCRLLMENGAKPTIEEWRKIDVDRYCGNSTPVYSPLAYSQIAYDIVNQIVYNSAYAVPDLVLIERQRLRSGSSKNVFEHVLRVIMLENMLHASIYAVKKLDPAREKTRVDSSSPAEMVRYWCTEEKLTATKSKTLRVNMVARWLEGYLHGEDIPFELNKKYQQKVVNVDPKVKKLRSQSKKLYKTIMKGEDSEKEVGTGETEKGDDLVDSLLHGLAFHQWQCNRRELQRLVETGKGSLEEMLAGMDKRRELNLR